MTRDELTKIAQEVPPELMQEFAKAALMRVVSDLAAMAERMAPTMRATNGEEALMAFARAMQANAVATWGGRA